MTDINVPSLLERLFAAADGHGAANGDPDYTVGDLQIFLTAALELLAAAASLLDRDHVREFLGDSRVAEIITEIPEYEALASEYYEMEDDEEAEETPPTADPTEPPETP